MSSNAASVPTTSAVPGKTPRILACVLCQHRKIKCDRSFPCANCLKANVQCTPSTPAPARKRRRPNQDLQERLARCEELLKEYAAEGKIDGTAPSPKVESFGGVHGAQTSPSSDAAHGSPATGTTQSTPSYGPARSTSSTTQSASSILASPSDTPSTLRQWQTPGKLVREDGNVRFMDSFVIGTIHEELKAMREIIDRDEISPEEDASDSMTPDTNADLLFGGETPSAAAVADLQPAPGHIFRLWQIFLDRVNPLTKVIHMPTLQPYLVDSASDVQTIPRNVEALLFSIYTLAVVAMSEEECQSMLGSTRESALQRFSTAVRMCLLRMGFLKNHDLITLQALVLYLISLQGRYNRHAAWILNGVVVRIAQKMGLHRDGEALGLTPFETEMRRRLWWQIISIDAKYSIISGLGHSLLPRVWDAKEPKNVNDADLHPSATEPIQDRDGPTEMIFALLTYKVSKFIIDSPGIEPMYLYSHVEPEKLPGAPTKEEVRKYRALFEELVRTILDLLDKRCDPQAGPLHQFTIDFKSLIMEKLEDIMRPPSLNSPYSPKDHLFKMAVDGVGHGAHNYMKAKRAGFYWFARLQFQMEILLYLAGQLVHRPSGELEDRAWDAIDAIIPHHPELLTANTTKENLLLGACLVKAWKVREDYHLQHTGIQLPVPEYIQHLRNTVPPEYIKQEESPGQQHMEEDQAESESDVPIVKLPPGNNSSNNNGGMAASFDDFLGSYPETDWDMFSNMNIAGPTPGGQMNSNTAAVFSSGGINFNNGPNISPFGPFGLGPATEW